MSGSETSSICGPEAIRRELIAEHWRSGTPTTEIARALAIDEAEVCRVIEDIEQGKADVRNQPAG